MHPKDIPNTLFIEREIAAPIASVWRCWTEPELFMQWYVPQPWFVSELKMNVVPGGGQTMVFNGPDGERMPLSGIYLEIVPMKRLIFTDGYSEGFIPQPASFMTGCVEFSKTGDDQTAMIWSARHSSEEQVKQHLEMGFEDGWNKAADQLEALAKLVEPEING